MKRSRGGWRLDDDGRLYAPGGAFVARLVAGQLLLYDKRAGTEHPFTLEDWWQLVEGDLHRNGSDPAGGTGGVWGR